MSRQLGLIWLDGPGEQPATRARTVNTRVSLWPERWPAIALQECVDIVEAAPPDRQAEAKYGLPCHSCPEATRCLNAKAKELGTLMYDREELTNPRSSESSLFPRALMEPMLQARLACVQAWHRPPDSRRDYGVAQAWDLAWSERVGGDYLVCMTAMANRVTGQRRLLGIERWQRLTFDEQCKLIEFKWRQYGSDVVVVESDAAQAIWAQHLTTSTAVPVIRHDSSGKRDLSHGVPGLLIELQNRKWDIPYSPGTWGHDEVENWLTELEAFSWSDGKLQGVGEHDDTVMAFWHLAWGVSTMLLRAAPLHRHVGTQPGASA